MTRSRRAPRLGSSGASGRSAAKLAGLVGLLTGCGAASAPSAGPPAGARPSTSQHVALPRVVPSARLVPDLEDDAEIVAREATRAHQLVGRLRITTDDDGGLRRASELLPVGRVIAQELPSRLGGGYVFLAVGGRGTELWRSREWLGPLEPLASLGSVASQESPLVAGFDRLYVRLRGNNELVGLDPETGAIVGRGPLPAVPSVGDMLFVDGWRAVVDAELAGPLMTIDAGRSWHPIPLEGRLVRLVPSPSGDPLLLGERGAFLLAANGELRPAAAPPPSLGVLGPSAPRGASLELRAALERGALGERPAQGSARHSALGKNPLKAALLWGHPDGAGEAVVARAGTLARVDLSTGRVIAKRERLFAEERCQGIALGAARSEGLEPVGFVCSSSGGPTAIYELERPLGLREVMRFATPRVVVESGQGAIVVRGPCADVPEPTGARAFCVRSAEAEVREIRVRGESAGERVVSLADGRTAILVPPRAGAKGQVSLVEGDDAKHVVLQLPAGPEASLLEVGLWQEGFVESAPGEIAGWVEAGGPAVGVRVELATGRVSAGEIVDEPLGLLAAGPRALALGDRGRLLESVDFGKTWSELELPRGGEAPGRSRERRCGPVGCVLDRWLRVGWGEPSEGDLVEARSPASARPAALRLSGAPPALECESLRTRAPGVATKPRAALAGESPTGWQVFRGVEPPPLAKGDAGIDAGAPFDAVPMRVYVWGPRDADWARAGRMLLRFSDRHRFDDVVSTAITSSPYATRELASEALGVGAYGYSISWSATRDAGAAAALVSACRGRSCVLFAAEADRPLTLLSTHDASPVGRPIAGSAVRLPSGWYFLAEAGVPDGVGLFHATGGRVRRLAVLPRLASSRFGTAPLPKLVRRARGEALGLYYAIKDGPSDRRGTRVVAPIDLERGSVEAPIELGADLASIRLDAGCGDRDGWVVELGAIEPAPLLSIDGARATVDALDLRVRLDPGRACVESAAATLGSSQAARGPGQARPAPRAERAEPPGPRSSGPAHFSLVTTSAGAEARAELRCRLRDAPIARPGAEPAP